MLRLLRLFADHTDAITYRGTIPDLLGRPAVAFSAVLPGAADAVATLLFSPDTGQPVGWGYGGGPRGWRLELIEIEVLDERTLPSVSPSTEMPSGGPSPTPSPATDHDTTATSSEADTSPDG